MKMINNKTNEKINHRLGHVPPLLKMPSSFSCQSGIQKLLHVHRNLLIGHEINLVGPDQHFYYMEESEMEQRSHEEKH